MSFSNTIRVSDILSFGDFTVFLITVLLTVGSVLYGHRLHRKSPRLKSGSSEISSQKPVLQSSQILEYLLMGRKLTLPLFVATLASTWYGNILGVTQISYNHGIYQFLTQGIFFYIAYLFFAFFLLRRIRKHQAVTLPDLIEKMFGKRSAQLSALLIFIKTLPITYTVSIGLVLQLVFNLPLVTATAIGIAFVAFYSLWGGFRAVVFSDVIQFLVMWTAVAAVVIVSATTFGGLGFLKKTLPSSYFSPWSTYSISTVLVWLFLAFATTLINPTFYQRCFAAQNEKTARYGILISIGVWFIFDLCTTFGGMYAKALLPDANALNAYFIYGLQILPEGLRGLLIAGLVCTILSTLDSFLFISSTILSYDICPPRWREKKSIQHGSILITAVLSFGIALTFEGHIENIWRTFKGFFSACLLFPLLIGYIFPKKLSDRQFLIGCLSGMVAILGFRYVPAVKILQWDSFYVGLSATTLFFLSLVVFQAVKPKTSLEG